MSELSIEALRLAIAALEQGLIEHQQYPQLLTVRDVSSSAMKLRWMCPGKF